MVSSAYAFASPATVQLGNATSFAILSYAGISSASNADVINGNIGVSPTTGASIGVFCSEMASGKIFEVDAAYVGSGDVTCVSPGSPGNPSNKTKVDNAILDANAAITDANGRAADATNIGAGSGTWDLAGLVIAPGVYAFSGPGNVIITGDVTLSGTSSDVWIFQIPGTFDISSGITVHLSGGAVPAHVFWSVGGVATLETTSTMEGTVLGAASTIALLNGATLHGRAIAPVTGPAGAVTTTGIVTVTVPAAAPAPTPTPAPTARHHHRSTTPTNTSNATVVQCTPNYQCGVWTTCVNAERKRTCTDLNNCGTPIPFNMQVEDGCVNANYVSAPAPTPSTSTTPTPAPTPSTSTAPPVTAPVVAPSNNTWVWWTIGSVAVLGALAYMFWPKPKKF